MTTLTKEQLEQIIKQYNYQPYTAGCGPSFERVINNNNALFQLLIASKVEAKLIPDPDCKEMADAGYTAIELPNTIVVYDRWGFVISRSDQTDYKPEWDQIDICTAYTELMQMNSDEQYYLVGGMDDFMVHPNSEIVYNIKSLYKDYNIQEKTITILVVIDATLTTDELCATIECPVLAVNDPKWYRYYVKVDIYNKLKEQAFANI
jgi:hypothetical protein